MKLLEGEADQHTSVPNVHNLAIQTLGNTYFSFLADNSWFTHRLTGIPIKGTLKAKLLII